MGKFSLEFGRKGPEGLKAENDEHLIDDTLAGDGSEIRKNMQGIDTSMDEEDYSDCAKQPEQPEDESYDDCKKEPSEEEKEDDFSDCLKKATKTQAEISREDAENFEAFVQEATEIVEQSKDDVEKIKDSVLDIFG